MSEETLIAGFEHPVNHTGSAQDEDDADSLLHEGRKISQNVCFFGLFFLYIYIYSFVPDDVHSNIQYSKIQITVARRRGMLYIQLHSNLQGCICTKSK